MAVSTCATRSRSRATSTSTRLATCWASIASTNGREARARREDRNRPAQRAGEPRPEHGMETETHRRGGTPARRSPSPSARAQVTVTPASLATMHHDGGQRRHSRDAARGEGDRRGEGVEAGAGGGRRTAWRSGRETLAALHDGLWMVVNAAGTGGRGRIRRPRRRRQDGHGAGDLERGPGAGPQHEGDLRDHGWFVFFAPKDNPQIAGVIFAEHGLHGLSRRADREARDRNVFCQEGRPAAAGGEDRPAADAPIPDSPPRCRREVADRGRQRGPSVDEIMQTPNSPIPNSQKASWNWHLRSGT